MKPIVEIFSQGEEIVNGQIVDSNAAWLSQKLDQLGFSVKRHTAVGDHLEDLKILLLEISSRADCCICTGGLGPTVDDLTAQAVAEAFDRPLQLDAVALSQIQNYFDCRNRVMAGTNRKQAMLPQGSERIDNEWGTAPGFSVQHQKCWFVFIPGVPSEMKHLFDKQIASTLIEKFTLQPDTQLTVRTVGAGESDIQQKLEDVSLPETVQLGFRTGKGEIETKLRFSAEMEAQLVEQCVAKIVDCLGDDVIAIESNDPHQDRGLVPVISQLMKQKMFTLSIQETASQGLMAAKCIGEPWLISSRYCQSIQAVCNSFGKSELSSDMMQTAKDIAYAIHTQDHTHLVLVQLCSDPLEKLVDKEQSIILYNVLFTPEGYHCNQHSVTGSKRRKQNQAAIQALDFLRRFLQNKCL